MAIILDGTNGVTAAAVTTTTWSPTNVNTPGYAVLGDGAADYLTINGTNTTFAASGARILANSSGNMDTRFGFQNSTTNGNTRVYAFPNGTGNIAGFTTHNSSSDYTNYNEADFAVIGTTDVRISSIAAGTNAYLPITIWNGGSERVRITSAGSVGIGLGGSSPVTKLEVRDTAPTFRLQETTTGGDKRIEMGVTSAGLAWIGANQSAQDLTFQTVGTEKVRIDSTGNVGVGTQSPSARLHLSTTSTTGSAALFIDSPSSTGVGSYASFRKAGSATLLIGTDSCLGGTGNDSAIYTYGANSTKFYNNGAETMRIDNNGYVGIGSSNASDVLVVNNSNAYALGLYRNLDYNSVGSMASVLTFGGNVGSTRTTSAQVLGVLNTATTGYLSFNVLNAGAQGEKMRILYNGNVGIGTFTNLNSTLTVAGTITCGTTNSTGGSTLLQNIYSQSSNDYVTLIGEEYSTGAVSLNYAVRNSTTDTGFTSAADNVAWSRAAVKVGGSNNVLRAYGLPSTAITKGSTANLAKVFELDNSGNAAFGNGGVQAGLVRVYTGNQNRPVGIGAGSIVFQGEAGGWVHRLYFTAANGTDLGGYGFNGSGNTLSSYQIGTAGGTGVYLAYGATGWSTWSDIREKNVLGTLENGLSTILAIEPIYFLYKSDDQTRQRRLGFSAQNVQEVLPEAVTELEKNSENPSEDSKRLSLSATELIPVLVKAIQEQQEMIDELKAKVAALEAK